MPYPGDLVEQILLECLDRDRSEWAAAIAAARAAHPSAAEELDRRYQMIQQFGETGSTPDLPERLGEFRIEAILGRGNMGIVYRAVQESLSRVVAVKLLRPELLFFADTRRHFEREISAVASLQHPSVVSIYGVGVAEGMPFYAMELLPGRSLADVLRRVADRTPESLSGLDLLACLGTGDNSSPSPSSSSSSSRSGEPPPAPLFTGSWVDACIGIGRQVASALAHAHRRGILHRDIKPSNLMLTPRGRVVVLDFGLTGGTHGVDQAPLTRSGAMLGTPAYMAPEQIDGTDQGRPAADLYSLGVTLYELLTLRLPFDGDGVAGTHALVLDGIPTPIRAHNSAVSRDAQTVCQVAMSRHARDRYTSAADLELDLDHLLQRRPIRARPPRRWRRAQRWAQRRPAQACTVVLAALLAIGVPTALWALSIRHNKELQTLADSERAARSLAQQSERQLARALEEEQVSRQRARAAEQVAVLARTKATAKAAELSDVADFLVSIFTQALPGVSGASADLSAQDLVARGSASVGTVLRDRPASRARVSLILGTIYGGFGLPAKAAEHTQVAIDYFAAHDSAENLRHLAEALRIRSASLASMGQHGLATKLSGRALAAALRAYAPDDATLIRYYGDRAQRLGMNGEFAAVRRLTEQLAGDAQPANRRIMRGVVSANHGSALIHLHRYAEAEPILQRAMETLVDGDGDGDELRHFLGARVLGDLARVCQARGDHRGSIVMLERMVRSLEQYPRFGKQHYRTWLARARLLESQLASGQDPRTIAGKLGEVADRLEGGLSTSHSSVIDARINQMQALAMAGDHTAALRLCAEHDLVERVTARGSGNRAALLRLLTRRAQCLSRLQRHREAQATHLEALQIHSTATRDRADPDLLRRLITQSQLALKADDADAVRRCASEILQRVGETLVWLQPNHPGNQAIEAGDYALRVLLHLAQRSGETTARLATQSRLSARRDAIRRHHKIQLPAQTPTSPRRSERRR